MVVMTLGTIAYCDLPVFGTCCQKGGRKSKVVRIARLFVYFFFILATFVACIFILWIIVVINI
jgi:hypothetical protein